jgi:hypothetical protein
MLKASFFTNLPENGVTSQKTAFFDDRFVDENNDIHEHVISVVSTALRMYGGD